MPTDALRDFHEISVETMKFGIPELKEAQHSLGRQAHEILGSKGLTSVKDFKPLVYWFIIHRPVLKILP
jgi:hypothetical protein